MSGYDYTGTGRYDKPELPAGVNWEGTSVLFDFHKHPKLSVFPDLCRLLQVTWLALHHSGVLTSPKKIKLLDAACGYGEVLKIIRSQRLAKDARVSYVGIDIDYRKLKRAQEMMPKGNFREGLIQDLPKIFEGQQFDTIISTETVEHVEKEDGIQFLYDCYNLLDDGGHLILTVPTPHLHADNPWHIHEWEVDELREVISSQPWAVKDQFFMKAGVRNIGKGKLDGRVPNEMIRGVLSAAADEGSVQVWVLQKPGGLHGS